MLHIHNFCEIAENFCELDAFIVLKGVRIAILIGENVSRHYSN